MVGLGCIVDGLCCIVVGLCCIVAGLGCTVVGLGCIDLPWFPVNVLNHPSLLSNLIK